MRTEIIERKVYSFSELSEVAKEKAHSDYVARGDCWGWDSEARSTIEEVENLFHITLKNWEIGSYRPAYPDVRFDDWWEDWNYNCNAFDRSQLKGNRARAFLWNNFGEVLLTPKKKYEPKERKSKIFFNRVYQGTCPLTGVCFDCDALDPMAYFCFGVRWDEKVQKCVQDYSRRTLAQDDRTTVEDVIRDCVYALFDALNKDIEWAESREAFVECCDANDYEFLEDGTMI